MVLIVFLDCVIPFHTPLFKFDVIWIIKKSHKMDLTSHKITPPFCAIYSKSNPGPKEYAAIG